MRKLRQLTRRKLRTTLTILAITLVEQRSA